MPVLVDRCQWQRWVRCSLASLVAWTAGSTEHDRCMVTANLCFRHCQPVLPPQALACFGWHALLRLALWVSHRPSWSMPTCFGLAGDRSSVCRAPVHRGLFDQRSVSGPTAPRRSCLLPDHGQSWVLAWPPECRVQVGLGCFLNRGALARFLGWKCTILATGSKRHSL